MTPSDGRTGDRPAADQPAADQPAADQPAADQPAADQPAADQPAADQPAADQPAADQPAADQPAGEQPADRITIRGLRVRGHHGVLPAERRDGQDFVVDAELSVDTRRAAAGDDLADTVDYAALVGRLAEVVAGKPVDLLETLADRLAAVCLADRRVCRVSVTVHKPDVPLPAPVGDVSVTVVRPAR